MEQTNLKKSLYKNVLTFPNGTEHLKYFDKNPHPDKIPDKLLAIWEAFGQQDLNVNFLQKKLEFESVKKFLYPHLSDKDIRLLELPDKMQEIIESVTNLDRKIAYALLRDCFLTFFFYTIG